MAENFMRQRQAILDSLTNSEIALGKYFQFYETSNIVEDEAPTWLICLFNNWNEASIMEFQNVLEAFRDESTYFEAAVDMLAREARFLT